MLADALRRLPGDLSESDTNRQMTDFRYYIYQEDCLEVLRRAPDAYFDSMVTDPPAGIGFMHREWDSDKGGRVSWVCWMTEVMKECYRVLKPGAHALVWAIPRTSHWTATALEDAGFEVRDVITHHFGSGFPKSQDVGKFIDKLAGYRPDSDDGFIWQGWGTALKPATEHWILVRKPLSESSIARNVLKWGVGALNIDDCRVNRAADDVPGWHKTGAKGSEGYLDSETFKIRDMSPEEIQDRCGDKGRWPTNLVFTHAADCDEDTCCEDCPVYELDRQSGTTKSGSGKFIRKKTLHDTEAGWGMRHQEDAGNGYGDSGGASRFFPVFRYQAKPSRSERERGLDALEDSTLNRVNPGGLEEPELAAWYESVLFVARSIRLGHLTSLQVKEESTVPASVISQLETILGKEIPTGAEVDGLAQTAMSISGTEGITRYLSTVLSWNSILGALSEETSMFTTSTKLSLTTGLKTLNSCLQVSTPKDIFLGSSESEESALNAIAAKRVLNGWRATYEANGCSALEIVSENIGAIRGRLRFAPIRVKNNHPTCKGIELMRWLIRLITPLEGLILDPFCGSGTTGCAAMLEGCRFIGIDESEEYCRIAQARIEYWAKESDSGIERTKK